jgi:hypothetical protein
MRQRANNYRGKMNPARGECPSCEKKGLGPMKFHTEARAWLQKCRYCGHIKRTPFAALAAQS